MAGSEDGSISYDKSAQLAFACQKRTIAYHCLAESLKLHNVWRQDDPGDSRPIKYDLRVSLCIINPVSLESTEN